MPMSMYTFSIFMLIAALVGITMDDFNYQSKSGFDETRINNLAGQMLEYSTYAQAYLEKNPNASGVVNDATLNTPTWVANRDPRILINFSAGKGYVYCTSGCPRSVESALYNLTDKSINVGIVSNGKLSRSGVIDSMYTLPSFLKNDDIVYVLN